MDIPGPADVDIDMLWEGMLLQGPPTKKEEKWEFPYPKDFNARDAAAALRNNWDQAIRTAGGTGNYIQMEDITALAASPNVTPKELYWAALYLQNNPAMLYAIDTGKQKGSVDGNISQGDLDQFISRWDAASMDNNPGLVLPELIESEKTLADISPKNVAKVLLYYFDLLDTAAGKGGDDNNISMGDIQAFLSSNKNIPPELKAALEYVTKNPAFFGSLKNTANNPFNRDISGLDLALYIQRNGG